MRTLLVLFVFSAVVGSTIGKLKKCVPPNTNNNGPLKMEDLTGLWYELKSTDNWWFKTSHKCAQLDLKMEEDGIHFTRTSINKAWFWTKSEDSGVLQYNLDQPWAITYSWKSLGMTHSDGPYHILGTDYLNYLILWKCEDHWYKDFSTEAYVLGRTRDLDFKKYETEINNHLKHVQENMVNYYEDNQSGCS